MPWPTQKTGSGLSQKTQINKIWNFWIVILGVASCCIPNIDSKKNTSTLDDSSKFTLRPNGKSENRKKSPQSWRMMEKKTSFFVLCRSQTHGSTAVAVSARPFGVRPRKVPPFHRWQPCEAEDQSPGVNIKDYFDVKQQQTSHIQP